MDLEEKSQRGREGRKEQEEKIVLGCYGKENDVSRRKNKQTEEGRRETRKRM